MKLSISLDKDSVQMLLALKRERPDDTVSKIVQEAIVAYGEILGYELIPAHVVKKQAN